jgi:hypothetical protein
MKIDTSRPETWRWVPAGFKGSPHARLFCHGAMSLKDFVLVAEAIELDPKSKFVQVARDPRLAKRLEYIHELQEGEGVATFTLDNRTYVLHLTPKKK